MQGNLLKNIDNKTVRKRDLEGFTLCLHMFSFQ
jgi:hypothetical protein